MINCKDCVFWDRDATKDEWDFPPGLHHCLRVKEFFDSVEYAPGEWPEETPMQRKKECERDTAFVNDGSSYKAALLTFAEFGCPMGEVWLPTREDPS